MALLLAMQLPNIIFLMTSGGVSSASQAIDALCGEQIAIDRLAGGSIQSDILKLIYDTFVNISYILFLVGGVVSLATNAEIRQKFIDYLKRSESTTFLIIIGVLAVISYTLMKAYGSDKKYSAPTKKVINFA